MKVIYCIVLFLFSYSMDSTAQEDEKIIVQLSEDTVLFGNYFEVRFTIINETGKFEAPSFEGFKIVGGPNSSSSVQIINGEVSQKFTYSYFLEPQDIGMSSIPEAYFYTDEGTLESMPMTIHVLHNPDGILEEPGQISESEMDKFSNKPQTQARKKPGKKIKRYKI